MCNGTPFAVEKISPRVGIKLGPLDQLSRTALNLLSHWGSYQEIKEDNANISRVVAGGFVSLMFHTLVISYPTGVSNPKPKWMET